jgi:hypothetical protein
MLHARNDYNRIQDPAQNSPDTIPATPIGADEPVFLLRGQDRTAAAVVRHWADLNAQLPDHDPKAVELARAHADLMDKWPTHKTADV